MDLTCNISFVLIDPDNPAKVGAEAPKMVGWAKALAGVKQARNVFENVVRQGFDYNFEHEGVPSGQWAELNEAWTQKEREDLLKQGTAGLVAGFTPEHPILQRTGKYRQSWVDMNDPDSLSLIERPAVNDLIMYIGSADDRVAKLSGGKSAPLNLAMDAEGLLGSETMFDIEDQHPWSRIPPRPVNELFEQFEQRLTELADSFGEMMAARASARY